MNREKNNMNTIPKNKKDSLLNLGFDLEVYDFEKKGTIHSYGYVGNITNEYTLVHGMKLKKGDTWTTILDPIKFTISHKKGYLPQRFFKDLIEYFRVCDEGTTNCYMVDPDEFSRAIEE